MNIEQDKDILRMVNRMRRLTKTGAKEAIKYKLKVKRTKNHVYLMEEQKKFNIKKGGVVMAKSKYESIVEPKLVVIEGWARNGLTIEQIAKNLGISKVTFYKYISEHTELSERLKKGKEVVDIEVENALLKRALGYKVDEITKELITDEETGISELKVTKVVTKEVAPDTTAQIFWLKNRKPEEWRDKKEVKHDGNINNPYENLTKEQLLKIASEDDG